MTGYRPWLDGFRGVAVLLVVVQHTLGAIPIELGSIGVALFFALSGYLITSLLLDERSLRGTVSLPSFYLRRAARLVPALVLVLVVCDALFALQGDYDPITGSLFALTYTANYAEVLGNGLVPAFGPTWSLAIEEHFYVIWPFVLLAAVGRRGLGFALWATVAVCVAAMGLRALELATVNAIDLVNLGSVERADALLYGCAAAVAVRLGWRPRSWMVWAGIAVVAALMGLSGRIGTAEPIFGHAAVAIAGAAVVVGLDYAAPPVVRRCLSGRAIVRLGLLSYALYLWHGPLMHAARTAGYSGRSWRAVAVLVALLAAAASRRYVEVPVRQWARRRSPAGVPTPRP